MFGKNKVAMMAAEFLGTGVLTLVVLSVHNSSIGISYFVALAAGLTVALMTLVFGKVSGAHLNPALTLGLWTARKVETVTAVVYIAMQLLGAWAAYGLYTYLINNSLQQVGGHFTWRVLIAEGIGTLVFALGWAAAAYQKQEGGVKASVSGASYALGLILASSVAVGFTIGLANPALALGTKSWVWGTYVLGPVVGAVVGVNLYAWLFAPSVANKSAAAKASVSASSTAKKPAKAKAKAKSKKK